MKKIFLFFALAAMSVHVLADDAMTKQKDGTYVVNSTTLCQARGYKAETPVEVYIKSGKVVKVVPLSNKETPRFFKRVTDVLLGKYEGVKVTNAIGLAEDANVDGCTGATLSAKALQQHIREALLYYKKKK